MNIQLTKFDQELKGAFARGAFDTVIKLGEKYLKQHPGYPRLSFFLSQAYELKNMPHLSLLCRLAEEIDERIIMNLVQPLELWKSPAFELEDHNPSWLVFAKVSKTTQLTPDGFDFHYHDVEPINTRAALPSMNDKSRVKFRYMEKILRERDRERFKKFGLIRIPERGGAHFANSKIKKMMEILEGLLDWDKMAKVKEMRIIVKSKSPFGYEVEGHLMELEHKFNSLVKSMRRYQVIVDIVNWRIGLDASALDGGHKIPINYRREDVKKTVLSYSV